MQAFIVASSLINILINSIPVKEATEVCFLGVMLDPLLN